MSFGRESTVGEMIAPRVIIAYVGDVVFYHWNL